MCSGPNCYTAKWSGVWMCWSYIRCYRSAVLPEDGPGRSEICRSLMSYLNIVNLMTIVCIFGGKIIEI
jgi:hypothetical protein